jgi:hypothetical protein
MREPFSIGVIGWGDWIERRIMRFAPCDRAPRGFGQARQQWPQQQIVRLMIYSEGCFESVFGALRVIRKLRCGVESQDIDRGLAEAFAHRLGERANACQPLKSKGSA